MTPAKHTAAPKRGEIGLAQFHRMVGGASFVAAICLMLASVTALYWFASVIGLPPAACVLVAFAFELMAAMQAASATTAKRANGKPDLTAWVAYGFFISVTAFANIMHAITFLNHTYGAGAKPLTEPGSADLLGKLFTNSGASIPDGWGSNTAFIVAACFFAAACAFGGSFGVHRFGWLRGNGADADWVDTADGVVTETPPGTKTKTKTEQKTEQKTAPEDKPEGKPETKPPTKPETQPKTKPAAADKGWQASLRELFDAEVAANPDGKPDAAALHRTANLDGVVHPTTSRRFVREKLWEPYEAQRKASPRPLDLRTEIHAADPDEDEIQPEPVTERRTFGVA